MQTGKPLIELRRMQYEKTLEKKQRTKSVFVKEKNTKLWIIKLDFKNEEYCDEWKEFEKLENCRWFSTSVFNKKSFIKKDNSAF